MTARLLLLFGFGLLIISWANVSTRLSCSGDHRAIALLSLPLT